jgi:hypothetical protein
LLRPQAIDKELIMRPITDNATLVLTLDYNDVQRLLHTLSADETLFNDCESEVVDDLLDRLVKTCDQLELEDWLDGDAAWTTYDERPVGAFDLDLSTDEYETVWQILQRDPGTEVARTNWMDTTRIVELGLLTSCAFDETEREARGKVRLLAQLLLHRAQAYAPDTDAVRSLQLVYGTLAAHWFDESPWGPRSQRDLSLALLVALGALEPHPEHDPEALHHTFWTLQTTANVTGELVLNAPDWLFTAATD